LSPDDNSLDLWLLWIRLFAAAAPAGLRPAVAVAADLDDMAVMYQPVHRPLCQER
jgi:hypothetical protein